MQMSINEPVWVELTREGERTYKNYYKNRNLKPRIIEKDMGWSRFQMWELMMYFGSGVLMGGRQQFKKNVLRFTPPI